MIVYDGWPAALRGPDEVPALVELAELDARVTRWCGLLIRSCCTPTAPPPVEDRWPDAIAA